MNFKNLSIGRRLATVLGLVLVLSAASSGFAVLQLRNQEARMKQMVSDNVQNERDLADWLRQTTAGVQRAAAIAKSSDPSLIAYFAPATALSISTTNQLQKRIEQNMETAEERELFANAGKLRTEYLAAREEVSKLKKAGDAEGAARTFAERFEPSSQAYLAAVQKMMDSQRAQLDSAAEAAAAAGQRASALLMACVALSLGVGAFMAWRLAKSITQPLRLAGDMADSIGKLDLTDASQPHYASDETGHLLRSIDTMRSALTSTLAEMRQVADGLSTASSEIATGNQDLSVRTEQTASNLQLAASSMEQLTSTVQQSVGTASQANQFAMKAAEVAQRGGDVVSQVVATMNEINGSSKRIADIIAVIDGIAFQTNILALNAAVEAARAGENGRGFAVVASEVRSLAQRSAEAAKEIRGLIGNSVDRVDTGSKLVREAGMTMTDIVDSVKRVSDMIGEITTASTEQSQGIGEVNVAVGQLDQMTQQNAALVEESAAAAESLKGQAVRLNRIVGTFKVA